ncbi:MAG TPA: hypothetical protein VMV28_03660 [Thermoplasmata archaeon]|nr:hypothetical protein [Thermoplasmata archaeon]
MVDTSLRFESPESSRKILKMPRRTARRSLGGNRRGIAPLVLGIVVVVVAVVVVAGGLFAAGVFNSKSSGGGTSATFAVTFTETGLLLGGSWSVTLGGSTQSSSSSSIQFNVANGSYSYSVSATGYTALPASGTLTVNGQPVSRAITITPIPTYSVVFTESALPSGTSWSVTLNGSTQSSVTSSITFTVPNGAYAYTIGTVSGYAASPSSGTLTVSGAAVSQAITFTKQTTYPVEFSETGLGVGTSWTVTLGGVPQSSATNTITFSEPNGTYSYTVGSVSGYTASPSSGSITVLGPVLTIAVTFTAAAATTYSVTFSETGLPLGTSWAVTLNGGTTSSSTSTIVFTEPNGTSSYTVGAVSGYGSSPSSGSVTVAGQAQTIQVAFTRSSSGGQSSYSQALPIATSAASSQGTGWALIGTVGFDFTIAPTTNSTYVGNSTCRVTGGTGTFPGIVTWTGAYSNGLLSQWIFEFYRNAGSTPSVLYVWVSGGSATVLGTISGSACTSALASLLSIGPNVVDSSTVASAIASNDSAYVGAWPQASAFFSLEGGYHAGAYSSGPLWFIDFTTCTPNGGGTGYNYTAEANATTGALLYSTTTSGRCAVGGFSPAAPSPLQFGTAPPRLSLDPPLLQGNTGFMPPARTTLPAQRPAVPTGARAAR